MFSKTEAQQYRLMHDKVDCHVLASEEKIVLDKK